MSHADGRAYSHDEDHGAIFPSLLLRPFRCICLPQRFILEDNQPAF
jgi:hypothetical protein